MKIQIDIKAADFEQLWINSMEWNGQDWEKQIDRFEPAPLLTWKYAYWFDNYAALKMAQAFLNVMGSNQLKREEGYIRALDKICPNDCIDVNFICKIPSSSTKWVHISLQFTN